MAAEGILSHAPLRAGDTVTDAALRRILGGVRQRTLPKPEWTHAAHLVFGAGLLSGTSLAQAEEEAPHLIRGYNEATGVLNDDASGYHHTITLFFLRRLDLLRPAHPIAASDWASKALASALARSDYPLRFFSKGLLFTVAARRGWVEPDLQPVDWKDGD